MIHKKKNNNFDIAIIGAGPIGMAFACRFANTNKKIVIIDKLPKKSIENPQMDGREIALTNQSIKILKKIDVWSYIPKKSISIIKGARVLDGDSKYFLKYSKKVLDDE